MISHYFKIPIQMLKKLIVPHFLSNNKLYNQRTQSKHFIILIIVPFNISIIKSSIFKIHCVAEWIIRVMNMLVKQSYRTMLCSYKRRPPKMKKSHLRAMDNSLSDCGKMLVKKYLVGNAFPLTKHYILACLECMAKWTWGNRNGVSE